MKNRVSTFTVEVPVRFDFKAKEGTDCDKLYRIAVKKALKRVYAGDVDFDVNKVEIVKERKQRTAEDIAASNAFWAQLGVGL